MVYKFYSIGKLFINKLAFMTSFKFKGLLKSYEKISNDFGLIANNTAFIKYIKLIAVTP